MMFVLSSEVPHYASINSLALRGEMFVAVGRFLGLALATNTVLGVTLPVSFWAGLTNTQLQLADIQDDEPVLYRSLQYMLTAEESDLEGMPLTIDGQAFVPTVHDREASVNRKINSLIKPNARPIVAQIREGLNEVVPVTSLRRYISSTELRAVFMGSPEIFAATVMHTSTAIRLWSVLRSFDAEMRKGFLKFATNLDNLPAGDFRQVTPRIIINLGVENAQLPTVSHCMNSVELKAKLTTAILESGWGKQARSLTKIELLLY